MAGSWTFGVVATLATILASLAIGCGGPGRSPASPGSNGGGSSFPSARDLDALADEPAPDPLQSLAAHDVDEWQLLGPFPERIAVAADVEDTAWDLVLVAEAQRRIGLIVPTAPMRCVAREVGNFYLENGGEPGHSLGRYFASRCNASVARTTFAWVHGTIPEAVTDEEIFAQWRDSLVESVRNVATGGAMTAGVWFGRKGDEAVAVAAAGRRSLLIDPVAEIPGKDGKFSVVGEMILPASQVSAVVSRGRYGYAECTPNPEVGLPRFAFDCEVDPGDESAIVSIGYVPPGRILGENGVNLLVWPAGRPTAVYRRPSYGEKHTVTSAFAARSRFIELLNAVRDEAGLEPVEEAPLQSEIASQLAPHYFAALIGETSETIADSVALGMIAGWSVEGILQSGHFTTSWVAGTNDVDRLLSEALEYPQGRSALLDPDVEKIAVGALVDADSEAPVLAAVIGTYELFSETEHAANVQQVYASFEKARSKQGMRPSDRLVEIEGLSMEAAGMVQAGVAPEEALEYLMEASVELLQRSVNGWIAQVSDLDAIEFPDDFVTRASVGIAVGVSYHRPENEPWGRYVVMVVASGPQSHRI
jgi:hypothetical protein